jgi:hypothetical protein
MTKRVIKEIFVKGTIPIREIESVVRAVHVVPSNEGWQVRKSGKVRITKNFPSKDAAVEYARNVSQTREVDLIVHSKNGPQIFVAEKNGLAK